MVLHSFLFLFIVNEFQLPDDLTSLWAYVTFHGGECQLNLNKKVTHLVVKEPKGVGSCALCFSFLTFRW